MQMRFGPILQPGGALLLVTAVLLLTAVHLPGAMREIEYKSGVEPRQGYIGDRYVYRFEAMLEKTETVEMTRPSQEALQSWQLLDLKEERKRVRGKQQYRLTLELTHFDTAFQAIPPFEFMFRDTVSGAERALVTDSVYVYIRSALDSLEGTPAEQYGPLEVAVLSRRQILLILLLLAGAGAALYIVFRRGRNIFREEAEERVLSPAEILLRDLESLRGEKLHLQGRFKDFFEEFNYILKSYLERLYFLHLKELSSRESLELLGGQLSGEELQLLRGLFEEADRVKYAAEQSGIDMCEAAVKRASELPSKLEKAEITEISS